jgi:hypothetical protein
MKFILQDGELVRAGDDTPNAYPRGNTVWPPTVEDGYRAIRGWELINNKWQETWTVEKLPDAPAYDIEIEANKNELKNADLSNISNMSSDDKVSLLVKAIKVIKSIF